MVANRAATRWVFATAVVLALAAIGYAVLRRADHRGAPAARSVRLAVLPLENLTGRQDQQFSADLAADPVFNGERADPRFQAALRRVGL